MRKKKSADMYDLEILLKAFRLSSHFRTNTMRDQMGYLLMLLHILAERPGALVEGSGHRDTNQGLQHGDHEVFVTSDPDNPGTVRVILHVTIRLLKGYRNDDAIYKRVSLYPEPDENRINCPVMAYLALAFKDGVFEDITTPEELFFPAHPCTRSHSLRLRADMKDLVVFRREILDDGLALISPTKVMTWNMMDRHLKTHCRIVGYPSM